MIILASKSTIRLQMLRAAGVDFMAKPPHYDESAFKILLHGLPPKTLAAKLAEGKALDVGGKYPEAHVIGADQVLERNGQYFDKPKDVIEAKKQLQSLRDGIHQLHSAVCVSRYGKVVWQASDTAELKMRNFSDEFLEAYLLSESEHITSSVGGYKIEGRGLQLFDQIHGDYFTILGMPLLPLLSYFRQSGVIPS